MSDKKASILAEAARIAMSNISKEARAFACDVSDYLLTLSHPATQAGAVQAVTRKPLTDTQIAALRSRVPDGDFMGEEDQAAFTRGIEAAERHHGIGTAATLPSAAPGDGQGAAAYLMTRPSGTAWPLMPKDVTPEWREACAADGTSIQALYLAAPSTATAAREQEATKPDPKNCTAKVRCDNGRITTESCTTKKPLIDDGGSSDGERDYYVCPDCGKSITVDYREN